MLSASRKRKAVSALCKLVVIVSAAAGVCMSALAGREAFMGGNRVFMYFTIQSNIAIALVCAAGLPLLARDRPSGRAWYAVKLAGTVSITLTGAVFAVLLAPLLGDAAWSLPNTLTHAVVPLAAVADLFAASPFLSASRGAAPYAAVPPLLYAVYSGIGYVRGWEFAPGQNYPYFFLNWGSPAGAFGFTGELPYMGCVWWILALLVFLMAVGWCYTAAAESIAHRWAAKHGARESEGER